MNLIFITLLLVTLITVISVILFCYKAKKGVENFKNKNYSLEYCNEFAKDRCFYLRNTSDWYNCIQETIDYC